ncbi:MAG: PEGA domain-containing protein [Phycisphaerales bacterium]
MRAGKRTSLCARVAAGAAGVGVLGGCLERTVTIKSDPPGAVAWVNDVEIGRTPATAGFEFYGVYEVRLAAEGYEPITVGKRARAPIYEYPPVDLAATVIPARIQTELVWQFEMQRSPKDPGALVERARGLRTSLGVPKP